MQKFFEILNKILQSGYTFVGILVLLIVAVVFLGNGISMMLAGERFVDVLLFIGIGLGSGAIAVLLGISIFKKK